MVEVSRNRKTTLSIPRFPLQLRRGLGKPLGGTEISSATAPGDGKMEMEFYLNIMLF